MNGLNAERVCGKMGKGRVHGEWLNVRMGTGGGGGLGGGCMGIRDMNAMNGYWANDRATDGNLKGGKGKGCPVFTAIMLMAEWLGWKLELFARGGGGTEITRSRRSASRGKRALHSKVVGIVGLEQQEREKGFSRRDEERTSKFQPRLLST
ncbi:hypothetical protein BDY19DRAFT_903569 [Irpex rosettiformis]|uniref:Uncharacterized protein n=1 Tax=Irpex rosettiformis TaxID=378272 RepID=A0ACB8UEN9_9APHY|nr:hypothetical protein BDY19DRAFT_903569 [Irpex rosettiformis]